MASSFTIHRTIAIVLNAAIIAVIIYFVLKTDSDKSPAIFMIFFPALALVNLAIAIVLSVARQPSAKIYRQVVLAMVLLFVPLIWLISQL